MLAARHFDPAPRPQVFLAEHHHRHQRADGRNVHPVNLLEQGLVVQQADQEHADETAADPVELLDVGAGEFRVHSGAMDFHDAQPAKHQDKDQQQPVEVAV